METFSTLLALCAGNSPVTGEFPSQRPVTRSFEVFFDLRLNQRLSKLSWGWWFETQLCSLWRHCNDWFKFGAVRQYRPLPELMLNYLVVWSLSPYGITRTQWVNEIRLQQFGTIVFFLSMRCMLIVDKSYSAYWKWDPLSTPYGQRLTAKPLDLCHIQSGICITRRNKVWCDRTYNTVTIKEEGRSGFKFTPFRGAVGVYWKHIRFVLGKTCMLLLHRVEVSLRDAGYVMPYKITKTREKFPISPLPSLCRVEIQIVINKLRSYVLSTGENPNQTRLIYDWHNSTNKQRNSPRWSNATSSLTTPLATIKIIT